MSSAPTVEATRSGIVALLVAIESRDLRLVAEALSPTVTWQNVPSEPVDGRDAVVTMFADILTWSDEVCWQIVSERYDGGVGNLDRIDRFLIDGTWHEVRCNGTFDVDSAGLVNGVRDDVDLGEWRSRIDPVLEQQRTRSPLDVVHRHATAVGLMDSVAMAADYAPDAVLRRNGQDHDGWSAIADYFDTVPDRLAGRRVEFVELIATAPDTVVASWQIVGTDSDDPDMTGHDTFEVHAGRITRQVVELDAADF